MSSEQLAALKAVLRERGKPDNPTVPEMARADRGSGRAVPRARRGGCHARDRRRPLCGMDRRARMPGGPRRALPAWRRLCHRLLRFATATSPGTSPRRRKRKFLLLDYRLAPESPFPAAVDDAVAAYCWLLDQGYAPGRLSIAGDSAGGGLTVAALVALRYRGQPMPAAGLCLSPWVDMEGVGASMTAKEDEDPTLNHEALLWFSERYLAGADPRAPLAAPIYADLAGLPPLLVQVGTAEVLLDDSLRLAERAREAGVDVSLDVAHDMMHVWHLFEPVLDEAGEAIARAGAFLRGRMR